MGKRWAVGMWRTAKAQRKPGRRSLSMWRRASLAMRALAMRVPAPGRNDDNISRLIAGLNLQQYLAERLPVCRVAAPARAGRPDLRAEWSGQYRHGRYDAGWCLYRRGRRGGE